MTEKWYKVAEAGSLAEGQVMTVMAGQQAICLIHTADYGYTALDNRCPHQGGPLGKGALNGHIVTCPWHGWQFDVRNGENQITPAVCQPQIPVFVKGDQVMARRPDLEQLS